MIALRRRKRRTANEEPLRAAILREVEACRRAGTSGQPCVVCRKFLRIALDHEPRGVKEMTDV